MENIYDQQAKIFKVLSHPLRLKMVKLLGEGELTSGEIGRRLGSRDANTSQHLAILRWGEIVEPRKDGLQVYYRLKFPCVLGFFSCVEDVLNEKTKEQVMMKEKRVGRRKPIRLR
jgi:DNA-binding transcriptional ArsR family regulator